jgi:hypothetical protein
VSDPIDIKDIDGVDNSPGRGLRPGLSTPIPDAFTSIIQAKRTYYTTRQFAQKLRIPDKKVHRWCQLWYGHLPIARTSGKSMGYRIHPFMLRAARGWLQTKDPWVREGIVTAVRRAGEEERDWVVVVGKTATAHYTAMEALEAARKVVSAPRNKPTTITVLYVGDPE